MFPCRCVGTCKGTRKELQNTIKFQKNVEKKFFGQNAALIRFNFVLQMNKNYIYLLIGGAAIYFIAKKGLAGKQIKWNITGIDFKKPAFSIEVINPTNTNLKFSGIVSDISINGSTIGTIDYRTKTELPGLAKKTIQVPITLNSLGIVSALTSKIKNIKEILFSGTINAEGVSFPFTDKIIIS